MSRWSLFARSALVTALLLPQQSLAQTHPLDSLLPMEFEAIVQILQDSGQLTNTSRFGQIALEEPSKAFVKSWSAGESFDRRAVAYIQDGTESYKAIVDITGETVVSFETAEGQGMVLLAEFSGATELALASPEMLAGLEARGLSPSDVYCLPLTAGTFGLPEEEGRRLMKVPCFKIPTGSNWFAHPVEGLFATVDLMTNEVLEVVDTGVVPVPEDEWGYTREEILDRFGSLRGDYDENTTSTAQSRSTASESDSIMIEGSMLTWDIWRFHFRSDKRPGLVLSQIEVNDLGNWRSVLYQAHLSEVFVPYMDPDVAWYFRTYMDSGEYGFGIFMSPLRPGLDCPKNAKYRDVTMHDDMGTPFAIPGSVCFFERSIGDPLWRHFEFFQQTETEYYPAEGRAATELVVRYASQVGNYDYLVDYIFQKDGTIRIAIGATGLDATKGATAATMMDATAEADTMYGTLISPNLVAPFHSHFFSFRLDFDIDGEENIFQKAHLVPTSISGIPRTSMWMVDYETVENEVDARTLVNPASPAMWIYSNPNKESSSMGHHPGYTVEPGGSYAYPLLSPDDPPAKRSAFIEYQLWTTPYDPTQLYAGGEYSYQSDGNDTLKTWTDANRSIANTDLVSWYTVGFHHVTKMEDWPVMPMKWSEFSLKPFNFFTQNPSLDVATVEIESDGSGSCGSTDDDDNDDGTVDLDDSVSEPEEDDDESGVGGLNSFTFSSVIGLAILVVGWLGM